MSIKQPSNLIHYDQTQYLIDNLQLRGGCQNVATIAARNAIPESKRALLMAVSFNDGTDNVLRIYVGATVLDADWTNESNWITPAKFTQILFDITVNKPTHAEGLLFYDKTKKALSYYNESSDITVNLGQESLVRVKNNTGTLIQNGAVVTGLSSDSGIITIQLANAQYKEKSRFIGVATQDIENGAIGYVTPFGEVGGLDTSLFSAGTILYVGTTDGQYTDTMPTDGAYAIVLGMVVVSHASEGIIIVNPSISELTVEVTDTNGFPPSQVTGTDLSFVDGTRTFTIAPTGDNFHFYELGNKYLKTGSEDLIIANTEGLHFIYYDSDTLSELVNPTPAQIQDVILNHALICIIYWNATDLKHEFDIFEERHGISMSPKTHLYLHQTRGAQFISGYGLNDFAIGVGTLATDNKFSVADGVFVDEDITHEFAGSAVGDTIDVHYLLGSTPYFRVNTQAGYAILNATRLYYNQLSGATWQLTEAANDSYVLYHVFGINGLNKQVISVMGQNNYTTTSAAKAAASTEISSIKAGFALPEAIPIGTLIFQTRSAAVTGEAGTWNRSGTTITVTKTNHKLINGETITVTAIDGSQTTGAKVVTVLSNDTFSFVGVGSGNTAGVITYSKPAFTNATYSAIIKNIDNENYTDWRTTELAQGSNPTSHANLTNVLQAGAGVSDGHISDASQTIAGAKTFTGVMTLPKFTADIASTLTAIEGNIIYVTSTNATFTSIGVWCYIGSTWTKL